eukprot:SAG22_NODE_205_length_15308_cov_20.539023_21_plen_47_part_00
MLNDSALWGVVFSRNVSRGWKYYRVLVVTVLPFADRCTPFQSDTGA